MLSLFPHPHRRRSGSEAHAAPVIQQLVAEQKRDRVHPVFQPPPKVALLPKSPVLLRNKVVLPTNRLHRKACPLGSTARRPLPTPTPLPPPPPPLLSSGSSIIETSPLTIRMLKTVPPNSRAFTHCSGPPRSKNRNGKRMWMTISARSCRRRNSFDGVSPRRVGLGRAGGAVTGVLGPRLGSGH